MKYINTDDIIKTIKEYCKINKISLSKYAQLAGVSKSWISRLMTEKDRKISLQLAQQLLLVAGYQLKIACSKIQIKKISRLGKIK